MLIPLFYSFYGDMRRKEMLEAFEDEGVDRADAKTVPTEDEEDTEQEKEKIKVRLKPDVIGMIEMETLGICLPIVEGTGSNELKFSIGHMPETAEIGGVGNCLLAGHRGGRYGVFFRNLNRVKEGDSVKLTDKKGNVFWYQVIRSYVTHPYDQSVKNQSNQDILTLLTCEKEGGMRLVVECEKRQRNK